jgi:hypothetical protein
MEIGERREENEWRVRGKRLEKGDEINFDRQV